MLTLILKAMSKAILDKLRIDAHYYGDLGKQYMSNSDIGTLNKDPMKFGIDRADNANFAKGRLFHQLLLEPKKAALVLIAPSASRNTIAYKDFCKKAGVVFGLLQKEVDEIKMWAEHMKGNYHFYEAIYANGNKFEEPAIGEIFGMPFKGKADIETPDKLIDLKTTRDIDGFRWSARKYGYDSQAWIYGQLFGKPLEFYVIDKDTLQLGIFKCSEEFLERGKEKVISALEVYDKFFGEDRTEDIDNYFINEVLN